MLAGWNATATEYPREASIPMVFEAQVRRTPDAVAVVAADAQWTYDALNRQANRLAHYLDRHRGADRDGGRRVPGARARPGDRSAGGAQVWRGVCAAGLRVSAAPLALSGRGRWRGGVDHDRDTAEPFVSDRVRVVTLGAMRSDCRPGGREPGDWRGARRARLRRLHVGLDRRPEGRRGAAPRRAPAAVRWRVRAARPGSGDPASCVADASTPRPSRCGRRCCTAGAASCYPDRRADAAAAGGGDSAATA